MIRIFIADDDADDLDFFKEAMDQGFPDIEVTCAADGISLLESFKNNTPPFPDIIFLDINMPRMNGLETLKIIRTLPDFQHLPVVILSTSITNITIEQCYEAGADRFISKPNSSEEFKRHLKTIIDDVPAMKERSVDSFYLNPNNNNWYPAPKL